MPRAEPLRAPAVVLALLTAMAAFAQPAEEGARALGALDPGQREELQRRLDAWDALPEAMRRDRRDAWQALAALPAGERARMRAAREAFLALPVAEQQALRARFDALDVAERRGWLLGPTLGADWPRLHPLFAQVPPDQRVRLLDALRALDAQARADLGLLAQRTPPQDREALRRDLMAQPAGQRAQWLRERVAP